MKTEHPLGYLFEISFNLGILTYIKQQNIKRRSGDLYLQDLKNLSFKKIKDRIFEKERIINAEDRNTVEKWCLFVLQKGFLSGYNFFREYLSSLEVKQESYNKDKLEIHYLQCNFSGDNSFGLNPKSEEEIFTQVLQQLTTKDVDISYYRNKGEFLKADTLMLIKYRREWRILSIDLSFFSFKSMQDLKDIDDIQVIREILLKEIRYLRSKSVFANLSIDTGEENFNLSEKLSSYLTAFAREDKESCKLIQAGSYAYSFYHFLKQHQLISAEEKLLFNIIGYTDRGVSAMCVNPNNLEFLKTCQSIYKNKIDEKDIDVAREKVFGMITRNAKKSFPEGNKLFKALQNLSVNQTAPIIYQEKITDFLNPKENVPPEILAQVGLSGKMSLRDAHSTLVHNALNSEIIYLFLTGNPGIGKTTALVKFLEEHFEEGFLFLYISPRKQVNLDIISKFRDDLQAGKKEQIFAINTDSQIIKSQAGGPTVQYFSDLKDEDFVEGRVNFLKDQPEREYPQKSKHRLKQEKEDLITDYGSGSAGVVNSLFDAVSVLIEKDISRQVIATLSIQALKKTKQGKDTLEHFDLLFKSAYNKTKGKVLPEKMRAISSKFKHLFIMIDEITGDQSGVEFLKIMTEHLQEYELLDSRHGFNTKIIVADASIVEKSVIEQHLSSGETEPNKIFYRTSIEENQPIAQQEFSFKKQPAIAINTNAYPASELIINYKIFTECKEYKEEKIKLEKSELSKTVNLHILNDIEELWQKPDSNQIIVYIQDKNRLQQLIEALTTNLLKFEKFQDYIEIHSNSSEKDIAEVKKCKNEVKIIFMTASASRGLSFPKVQHILVDIPRFSVEQNLMEIIQVIYRGRGSYEEDGQKIDLEGQEKELTFYLSEQIFYDRENPQLSLQERVLNIIDILLILKAAILTRIKGSSLIGDKQYKIIPVGGKSVLSADATFTEGVANLIEELKKQAQLKPSHKSLDEVSKELQKLLDQVNIKIRDLENSDPQNNKVSYLSLREPFKEKFNKYIEQGFDHLLNFPEIEPCHITGSLLIVPLVDKKVQEVYQMRLEDKIYDKLLNDIISIARNSEYPKNLKSSALNVVELIDKLKYSDSRTQHLQQNSQREDQYYAVPLFIFTSSQVMEEYFSKGEEDPDNVPFKKILKDYLSSLFPVGYVLPRVY